MRTALGDIPDHLARRLTMEEAYDYLLARRRRPTRRTFLRGAAGAAGLLAAGPTLWRQAARATAEPPAALHLATGLDPSREMVVSWSSPPGTTPVLRYGAGSALDATAPTEARTVAGVPGTVYHRATLAGLEPATAYRYEISHGPDAARWGAFSTAPATATGFRFAALGDMGATAAGQEITARIVGADPRPDLVFFAGDLCYADRLGGGSEALYTTGPVPVHQDLRQWDLWLDQIEPSASVTPWMFAPGNHEMEVGQGPRGYDGFLARMAVPLSGPEPSPYYWFRYQNVAFVALDANDVSYEITHNTGYTGGAQDAWLDATLAALRADPSVSFIVAAFHHCMYCSNTVHGSDAGPRDRWGALLDRYAVDVVVNGHNHSYERTHPVRAGTPTRDDTGWAGGSGAATPVIRPATDGTVYVTAGAGGQQAYPTTLHPVSYVTVPGGARVPETSEWSAARYLGDHSVLVVDATPAAGGTPARMTCEARAAGAGPDGRHLVVDRFVVEAPPP